MPGRVLVEQLALPGVVDGGEMAAQPVLEHQQVAVGDREDSMVHEQVTQVGDGAPWG
jgi:hypothetical protein